MDRKTVYPSPIGPLHLYSDGQAITGVYTQGHRLPDGIADPSVPVFQDAIRWLEGYFMGHPEDLPPLCARGTAFQKRIWDYLLDIPYGQVRTYGALAQLAAKELGRKKMSAQAVGQAVGANPISILIPCHRVIGANGRLTGYAGGIECKKWLLVHEAKV